MAIELWVFYCDTGHPFIMVISEDCDTHTYYRAFSSGAVTTCFYDLGISQLGFEHPTFRLQGHYLVLIPVVKAIGAIKFLHMETQSFEEFSKMTMEINLEDTSF